MKNKTVKITKVNNGYELITDWGIGIDGVEKFVFEEFEDENGDKIAMYRLLWQIIETFDLQGSKHDKNRLYVRYDKDWWK